MRAHWKKKTVVLTLGLVLVVGGGGAAFAYWTTTGSGQGSATTGTTSAIVVNQTSIVQGLYPGGTGVTLSGNFDNPNPGAVFVNQVNATITAVTPVGTPGCSPSDYTLTGFPVTVGAEIPHGTAVGAWGGAASIQMVDSAANQDSCKNATVTITYTSN